MTRTFIHQYEPAHESPAGSEVELTVKEIEAAGYREMLQTAGARLHSWSILDALLQNGVVPFIFKQPLGTAREVKVAASGLFGRFVARAYLTRYMGLTFFGHLGTKKINLDGKVLEISRKKGMKGDLPDWVACTAALKNLTVAEAKGCHDPAGAKNRLKSAWTQAGRVDVLAGGKRLSVKRIAIVTRWASAVNGAKTPIIAVHDPVDPGDLDSPDKVDDVAVGLARLHVADLLEPLGYGALADDIRSLLSRRRRGSRGSAPVGGSPVEAAITKLGEIRPQRIFGQVHGAGYEGEGLIGSLLTRAGPLRQGDLPAGTTERLRQLDLRPTFVGVEREVLRAVIAGDPNEIRKAAHRDRTSEDSDVSTDPGGTWLIQVGERINVR